MGVCRRSDHVTTGAGGFRELGKRAVKENELPDAFMDHLQFLPGTVPEGDVIPELPRGYPLIFVDPPEESSPGPQQQA
jgi:hypothetical protein